LFENQTSVPVRPGKKENERQANNRFLQEEIEKEKEKEKDYKLAPAILYLLLAGWSGFDF
jgi:hypothetical protein